MVFLFEFLILMSWLWCFLVVMGWVNLLLWWCLLWCWSLIWFCCISVILWKLGLLVVRVIKVCMVSWKWVSVIWCLILLICVISVWWSVCVCNRLLDVIVKWILNYLLFRDCWCRCSWYSWWLKPWMNVRCVCCCLMSWKISLRWWKVCSLNSLILLLIIICWCLIWVLSCVVCVLYLIVVNFIVWLKFCCMVGFLVLLFVFCVIICCWKIVVCVKCFRIWKWCCVKIVWCWKWFVLFSWTVICLSIWLVKLLIMWWWIICVMLMSVVFILIKSWSFVVSYIFRVSNWWLSSINMLIWCVSW